MKKDLRKQKPAVKIHPAITLAVIVVLGIIIYSDSFDCSFHFDDAYSIVYNTQLHNLTDLRSLWEESHTRIIAYYSFAINYHINGLDVWGYHFVNLMIHLITACMTWWLTLLILSSPVMRDKKIAAQKELVAFAVAILFVSHPLATQSVTYIVQRLTSMAAMFYLLSLCCYLEARLTGKGNAYKAGLFACSFLAAVLAMMTKQNAFTLPAAILLSEFLFLHTTRPLVNLKDYRVLLVLGLFFAVLVIILLNYSFSVFDPIPPSMGHTYTLTPWNYLFTQFSVILKYIQLLAVPVNLHMDYDYRVAETLFDARTLLSLAVILSLLFLAVYLFNRNRIITYGIAWFFLTLLVESSIIPIGDVINEHRTYLPSFGFFLVLVSAMHSLLWKQYRWVAIAVLAVIVISNSYLTYERNKVWKDDISLWTDNIEKTPDYARPYTNRGYAYNVLGQFDKAVEDCSRAIQLNPGFDNPYFNRGFAYMNMNKYDNAVADFSRAIEIDPRYFNAYNNRGYSYIQLKQYEKAIDDCSRATLIQPEFAEAWFNRGIAFGMTGKPDSAIADYTRALGIRKDYADAYFNRGNLYADRQKWDQAIDDYTHVIIIDPMNSKAYCNRGFAYGAKQQFDLAVRDCSEAILIEPSFANAWLNRGLAYSFLNQYEKAIADFNKALEIDPNLFIAYRSREIAQNKLAAMNSR